APPAFCHSPRQIHLATARRGLESRHRLDPNSWPPPLRSDLATALTPRSRAPLFTGAATMGNGRTTRRNRKPRPIRFRPGVEALELRLTPAAPVAPVIIEPQVNGQVTSNFDINLQTNPDLYSDPEGDAHVATAWDIRRQSDGMIVWQ